MTEGKGGDASKTVKQNDQKTTYGRRQSVQQENGKRVTRQERSFADVASQGRRGKPGYSRGIISLGK